MSNITFVVKKGGLARTASSLDHVSALVFGVNPPTSWGANRAKKYYDLPSAEADGFTKVSAPFGEYWYHISEFFRLNPTGALWVLMNPTLVSTTLIQTCQGEVRQIGAYITDVAQIGSVWQALHNTLDAAFCPAQIVVGWYGSTAVDPTSSTFNMQLKASPNVSLLAAGDGAGNGATIADALGKTYLPAIGSVLGAISRAKVSENVGWVEAFNFSDGLELETIQLSDGTLAPTESQIAAYDTAKIIAFKKLMNYGGTYVNDTYTGITETDDFATIENNRTMQKAKRLIRAALIPHFNRPIKVDSTTGKLDPGIVAYLESQVEIPLTAMQNNSDISGFFVSIDPNQNVLSTSIVTFDVGITPVGVARQFIVNIGYRVKLDTNF